MILVTYPGTVVNYTFVGLSSIPTSRQLETKLQTIHQQDEYSKKLYLSAIISSAAFTSSQGLKVSMSIGRYLLCEDCGKNYTVADEEEICSHSSSCLRNIDVTPFLKSQRGA